MRNPLLSKKLKRTETRLLIIDDNQIRYNKICELFKENEHHLCALLLDDVKNFEKQLQQTWDMVLFGRAYDLKVEQALALIRSSQQPHLPVLLIKPEDYETQKYPLYIRKGIYDIVNLDFPERCYYGLMRTLSFSRALQTQKQLLQELETFQTHAQNLAEESHKPIALIQEGIHLQANAEYLELFGYSNEDEIIGLPILDLLQPQDLTNFKFRFKKISQGQFDLGQFQIESKNKLVTKLNPISLEFMPAPQDEEAVQLTLDIEVKAASESITTSLTSTPPQPQTLEIPTPTIAPTAPVETPKAQTAPYQLINRTISHQPADVNALVLFTLASCPEDIFQNTWATAKAYFASMKEFIKDQTNVPLFKVDTGTVLALFQAESEEKLQSKLIGLNSLTKPQLLGVNDKTYPLNLRIGYILLEQDIKNESDFEQYISLAFKTPLPKDTNDSTEDLDLVSMSSTIELEQEHNISILESLQKSLERGEIHLKYQQLYDKEDLELYTYEVTSGFIYKNAWQNLDNLRELVDDPDLSIKLDRWILVEACKQLHNFTTQYPSAKLIINLNKHVLFQDPTFPELVAKLISILRSKQDYPLLLQFSEEDISQHFAEAQRQINLLRQHGAQVALRNFGATMYSESILKQLDITSLTLVQNFSNMLQDIDAANELQEKIVAFNEIRGIELMARGLDDMSMFANAWSVDVRYLQGDYFQKKLDHLIDVQDQ